jgi:hypothetical protein
MRRPWPGVFGVVIVCGAAWSEERPTDPYLAILDEARAAPVEIFADITFRLLDKLGPKEKAAALEEIFRRAGEARELVPLRYALPVRATGRAEIRERACNLHLDALSLRCRAVRECLGTDARLARALFENLPRPEVTHTDCDSEFAPDSGVFFETLAVVADRGAQTAGGSWEIVAAARELPRLTRDPRQRAILNAALAGALGVADSDRSYTTAVRAGLVKTVLAAAGRFAVTDSANTAIL